MGELVNWPQSPTQLAWWEVGGEGKGEGACRGTTPLEPITSHHCLIIIIISGGKGKGNMGAKGEGEGRGMWWELWCRCVGKGVGKGKGEVG